MNCAIYMKLSMKYDTFINISFNGVISLNLFYYFE